MYTDIIKILELVIEVLENNEKNAFKASRVYDIYRQFHKVAMTANHVLSHYLHIDPEYLSDTVNFESGVKKWIYFNNKNLRDYEKAKHKLLVMFGALESEEANPRYAEVFKNNFLSKSLSGRVDQYTYIANIDDDLQMSIYCFKLITNPKKVKQFRYFDDLFVVKKFDLSSHSKRHQLIDKTRHQIERLQELLRGYGAIMVRNYTMEDLLIEPRYHQ